MRVRGAIGDESLWPWPRDRAYPRRAPRPSGAGHRSRCATTPVPDSGDRRSGDPVRRHVREVAVVAESLDGVTRRSGPRRPRSSPPPHRRRRPPRTATRSPARTVRTPTEVLELRILPESAARSVDGVELVAKNGLAHVARASWWSTTTVAVVPRARRCAPAQLRSDLYRCGPLHVTTRCRPTRPSGHVVREWGRRRALTAVPAPVFPVPSRPVFPVPCCRAPRRAGRGAGDGLLEVPAPSSTGTRPDRPGISWATTPTMTAAPARAPVTVHRNTRRTRSKRLVPSGLEFVRSARV